ncbi:MAG TPA: TonB-dependent receptor [Vicinamibacteria bacterium]|nr:TonB-dependent receptor [Vicinamibacteria bacterium]
MRRSLVLFSALLAANAGAEPGGTLSGAVRLGDGTPAPQITLTLRGPAGARQVLTGASGRYRAAALPEGEYALQVTAPGFVLARPAVVVVGETDAQLDLVLAPAPVQELVIVTAARGATALSGIGVAASALSRERIEEREPSSLLALVQDLPGVAVARAGGLGLQGSVFLRGGDSRYARVLLDGVPLNQPGGAFDFGSALPLELERVEVLRGAGSSLYGTDALAGVIQLMTRRGDSAETPSLHAELAGGSFAQRRFQLGTAGRSGRLDWNLGLLRFDTDNQEPNSAFRENAGAASLGARLDERTSLRMLLRAEDSEAGTPGPTAFGRPDLDASFERTDLTLGGQLRQARERTSHELRLGYASSRQLSRNPLDSGSYTPRAGALAGSFPISDYPNPLGYQNDSARLSAGYQAERQAGTAHLLTAGVDLERESGELGSRAETLLSPVRTNFGFYLQDRAVLGGRVFATLGVRLEHNASFGTRVVPRSALALRLRGGEDATTLRASTGVGIKEPTFTESFGVSQYARGNPDLAPERSRTFDLGLEQRLLGGRLKAEATLFHHQYRDQIAYRVLDYTTFAGSFANLGEARARGLELGLEAQPLARLGFSAHYTRLDSEVLVSTSDFNPVYQVGKPLLRRPSHQGSLSARWSGGRLSGGATLVLVGKRADSDFLGLNLEENGGYARLDVRLRVRLVRGLEAYLVAENLLDREYQEVLGYPALGRSLRAGLRFRSGRRS